MLTSEQIDSVLRACQDSFLVCRGHGVARYDVAQLPSNDPMEDEHVEQLSAFGSQDWHFFGVMDGHAGGATSRRLKEALVPHVARELAAAWQGGTPTSQQIDESIKRGFVTLDDDICKRGLETFRKLPSRAAAAKHLLPALSGSCGLLAFFDASTSLLKVACTGDSRAVLGRRGTGGSWEAWPLSVDQTGSNPWEAERLRAEHPGESRTVVQRGRVLGALEPTRAFGDASYKWDARTQEAVFPFVSAKARRAHPRLLSPPYVTAEPVVTTTEVRPELGDFLVLASDGLWERLSNEHVVSLVGEWKDRGEGGGPAERAGARRGRDHDRATGLELPRDDPWRRFVFEDGNAATHLLRNALGGADHEELSYLLSLPPGVSRRYRDDITITVVFFGRSEQASGDIVVNEPASNPQTIKPGPRARL